MTNDQLALLADARLSREARIMGLHVASLGCGPHAIAHRDFRRLLGRGARGMAKDETIAGYVQELVEYEWVERQEGGQGSPIYTFSPSTEGGQTPSVSPPPRGGQSSPLPPRGGKEGALASHEGGAKRDVVVVEGVVVEEVGRASLHDFDERAVDAIDEANPDGVPYLEGCRGALRDYLATRVPTDRQYAYVRSIQAWLQGISGGPKGLLSVEDPVHLIATALNDLGTEDETTFKSGRGQVGVIATLRVKTEHLVRSGQSTNDRPRGGPTLFPEAETRAS